MPPLPLPLATGARRLFRRLLGLMEENQKILHPSSSQSPQEKLGRLTRHCIIAHGWEKSRLEIIFTMQHFSQCFDLWVQLQDVQLSEEVQNEITWKASRQYSAKSAYEVQFLSSITSILYKTVWKAWASPKAKFFAWFLTQKGIWTADRLQGWPNCGLWPIC